MIKGFSYSIYIYIFIKNVVAVAAYSWLASRSQAKFQTMKLSPLSTPQAAAPAQITISTCRSLRFSPRSCADFSLNTHCPSVLPRRIRARNEDSFVAAVTLVSQSQVWTFCEVTCGQEVEFISSPCQAVPVLTRWPIPDHVTGGLPLSRSSNSRAALTSADALTTTIAASSAD